jgi:TRAP-type C4-dicarboxylate transport system permease small subunit
VKPLLVWCASASRWLAWLGGLALLLSAALISLDVVFRGIWKITVFESFELSTYAFAIATALGMSYALVSRAHIRIEVVYNVLPLRWRTGLDVLSHAGLALITGTLLFWAAQMVWANGSTGARSPSALAIPLVIPQSLWLLGLIWFALLAWLYTLYGLWCLVSGRQQEAAELMGVTSLEDEIKESTHVSERSS